MPPTFFFDLVLIVDKGWSDMEMRVGDHEAGHLSLCKHI